MALWEIVCHAPGTKIDPHRARYFTLGLPILGVGDRVVRRVNSVLHFTRSSKLSNRTSPCSKLSIRGIRLHKLWQKSRASDYFNWRNGIPREHRSKTDRNVLSVRSRLRCRDGVPVLGHNFRNRPSLGSNRWNGQIGPHFRCRLSSTRLPDASEKAQGPAPLTAPHAPRSPRPPGQGEQFALNA